MVEFKEFMIRFSHLKEHAGTPQRLISFFNSHTEIKSAAYDLFFWLVRTDFERRALAGKKRFDRVPDQFEEDWNEFQREWDRPLRDAFLREPLANALPKLLEISDSSSHSTSSEYAADLTPPDPEHDTSFDPMHHDGGAAIRLGVEYWDESFDEHKEEIYEQIEEERFEDNAYLANRCRIAWEAYDYLTNTIDVDVDAMFRRWQALPAVLISERVSKRYGVETGSLSDLLDDAIRAYICGAPAAAIAMCRAVLELLLKEHYLPGEEHQYFSKNNNERRDKGLKELIALAAKRYECFSDSRVRKLKEDGDAVLHNYGRKQLSPADERILRDYLITLKTLIAKAP